MYFSIICILRTTTYQLIASADWQDELVNVAHHIPILYKCTPEWKTISVGFHCRRSSRKSETHKVLPAVDEGKKRGRERFTNRQKRGPFSFETAALVFLIVSAAGDRRSLNFHTNKTTLTSVTWRDQRERIRQWWPTEEVDVDFQRKNRMDTGLKWMW